MRTQAHMNVSIDLIELQFFFNNNYNKNNDNNKDYLMRVTPEKVAQWLIRVTLDKYKMQS